MLCRGGCGQPRRLGRLPRALVFALGPFITSRPCPALPCPALPFLLLHISVLVPSLPLEMREHFAPRFFRFFRITTCDHVFDPWETIPSGISNVLKFRNLHKSRANRFARRGNLTRVSGKLGTRTDLCSCKARSVYMRDTDDETLALLRPTPDVIIYQGVRQEELRNSFLQG